MKPSVLIVDDDQLVREAVAQFAEWAGFRVRQAPQAVEGMRVLASDRIDLIVTDLKMPGKSGIAFLSEARFAGHGQPAIVLTGYGTKESAIEAMRLGAVDFLEKPFESDSLQAILLNAVGHGDGKPNLEEITELLDKLVDALRAAEDQGGRQRALGGMLEVFAEQEADAHDVPEQRHQSASLGVRAARLLLSYSRTPPKDMARIMTAVVGLFRRSCNPGDAELAGEVVRFAAVLAELERRFRLAA